MQEAQAQKPHLTSGMFYMWRCLLALAWADGSCGEEETAYFAKVFDNLARYYDLTQEQRNALAGDLEHPGDAIAFFTHINEPEAREMLVVFAHDLAKLDGEIHPNEEEILKRLRLWDSPQLDKEALRAEVREIIRSGRHQRAAEKEEIRAHVRSMSPLYAAVDRLLLRLGIDLID